MGAVGVEADVGDGFRVPVVCAEELAVAVDVEELYFCVCAGG